MTKKYGSSDRTSRYPAMALSALLVGIGLMVASCEHSSSSEPGRLVVTPDAVEIEGTKSVVFRATFNDPDKTADLLFQWTVSDESLGRITQQDGSDTATYRGNDDADGRNVVTARHGELRGTAVVTHRRAPNQSAPNPRGAN